MDNQEDTQREPENRQDIQNHTQPESTNTGWLPPLNSQENVPENTPMKQNQVYQNPPCPPSPYPAPPYPQQNRNYQYQNPVSQYSQPYYPQPNFYYPQNNPMPYGNPSRPQQYPNPSYPPRYVSPAPYVPYSNGNIPYGAYPPAGYRPPAPVNPMWYPQQGTVINEDPKRPLSVLCSRFLSEEEYKNIQRNLGTFSIKTVGILSLCLLVFFIINFIFSAKNKNLTIVSLCLVVSVIVFLLGSILLLIKKRDYVHHQYELLQAISSEEKVIELYSDRIIEISKTSHIVIPYAEIKTVLERPELIAVVDSRDQCIVLRAEDMIAFDAKRVKDILYYRTPNAKKKFIDPFVSGLQEPLPIPIIQKNDKVLLELPLPTQANSKIENAAIKNEWLFQFILLIPFGISLGLQTANLFWLTYRFLIDILIFTGIYFVIIGLILGITRQLIKVSKRQHYENSVLPSGVAFTEYGAAVCEAGITNVISWDKLKATETTDGLLLQIFHNEKKLPYFKIFWSFIPDREKLVNLLTEHGCF